MEKPPLLKEQKIIAGRYQVVEKLGAGGVGVIYKARDTRMEKFVAIKILDTPSLSDDVVMRFQREAKAASQLSHPNLIKIFDFGITENHEPYMVMELVEGSTLSQIIKTQGHMVQESAVFVLKQICEAMAQAHAVGIVHRDLKTSNIMIENSTEGEFPVKILDFGIAKLSGDEIQQLTRAGTVFGTAIYMSPEQAQGKTVDHRSDIYSLGCMMYEMLTGDVPFRGETYMDTLSMQINQPPPKLSDGNAEEQFSESLEEVLQRAIAKDPADRFQSMREFAASLSELKSTEEETESHSRRFNETIVKIVVGAVVSLVILAGAAFAFNLYMTEKAKNDRADAIKNFVVKDYGKDWIVIPKSCSGDQLAALKLIPANVKALRSDNHHLKDSDLKYITALPLEIVNLSQTEITDAGMRRLAGMKKLTSLVVAGNKRITDKGAESFMNHSLEVFSLADTGITDECAAGFATMQNLRALDVSNCPQITDKTTRHLTECTNLRMLAIGGTHITSYSFTQIRNIRELKLLAVVNQGVTDADIQALVGTHLHGLMVNDNPALTNMSLSYISKMPSMKYVSIKGCPKISLAVILSYVAVNKSTSDNNFFEFSMRPAKLDKEHWDFYCDPEYFRGSNKVYMDKYGAFYGYNEEGNSMCANKVRAFLKDKSLTACLKPLVIERLTDWSEIMKDQPME